jgi:hypothetical protein
MLPSAWTYYDILYLGAVLVGFLGFGGTLFYESQRWERLFGHAPHQKEGPEGERRTLRGH